MAGARPRVCVCAFVWLFNIGNSDPPDLDKLPNSSGHPLIAKLCYRFFDYKFSLGTRSAGAAGAAFPPLASRFRSSGILHSRLQWIFIQFLLALTKGVE